MQDYVELGDVTAELVIVVWGRRYGLSSDVIKLTNVLVKAVNGHIWLLVIDFECPNEVCS